MSLKKLTEIADDNRITKNFSTGSLFIHATPTQAKVLNESGDFVRAIGSKLSDYCKFSRKNTGSNRVRGGPVRDRYWSTTIKTNDERIIQVGITQKYKQPGPRVIQADVRLTYEPQTLKKDVAIVRSAITSSGLTKK